MKIRIEMPADQYDQLLRICERGSPEFRILMGACIEDPAGKRSERIAEIRCEKEDVERLFEVANRLSLDAAKAVVRSLRSFQFSVRQRASRSSRGSVVGAMPAPYGALRKSRLIQYRKLPGRIHRWHCDPSCPEWPKFGFMEHTAPDVKTICSHCASIAALDSTTETKPRPKL